MADTPTILVTDTKYRASLAAVEALGRAGYPVAALHTKEDGSGVPPPFRSRYTRRKLLLPCSNTSPQYTALLRKACQSLGGRPVIFPIAAATLQALSAQGQELSDCASFLVSSPSVLDQANDKRFVGELARSLGVPVPEEFPCPQGQLPGRFPVIVKPRCGEKLGLHAEERYRKAYDAASFSKAYQAMSQYDPQPVVQELVEGEAVGVSAVLDRESRPVAVVCHRRVREYPIQGGPSSCCESCWDQSLVDHALRLLQGLSFVGMAMVEFKGGKLLEINPRVWGSFPLTYKCGSPFPEAYVRASLGERLPLCQGPQYQLGRRMQYLLNDGLACLGYLRQGQAARGLGGLKDLLDPRVKDGVFSWDDPKPFFTYLKNTLGKGGK